MPESVNAKKSVKCSFCGDHKDDVPLLVTSMEQPVSICSWCALGVVNQTFQHMTKIEGMIRELMAPPKIQPVPAGTQPDKLDAAIGKALGK